MGGLEPVGGAPAPRGGGEVAPGDGPGPGGGGSARRPPRFAGEPVEYGDWQYSPGDAWQLLSPSMRAWAEEHAGDPIRDPHTRVPTVYWTCHVRLGPRPPRGAAMTATYGLVMFGKRGLVASTGSTEHFVDSPGVTRWRNRRFAVPVDPARVRHDHRREAGPAAAAPGPGTGPGGPGTGGTGRGTATHRDTGDTRGPAAADGDAFLPPDVARMYGNLPLATQTFQCEPFVARNGRPAESNVFGAIVDDGAERRESYWAYMFDARWVTFAFARRAVPVPAGKRRGRGRGRRARGASDAADTGRGGSGLDAAEWRVAAWASPILRPGDGLARR